MIIVQPFYMMAFIGQSENFIFLFLVYSSSEHVSFLSEPRQTLAVKQFLVHFLNNLCTSSAGLPLILQKSGH